MKSISCMSFRRRREGKTDYRRRRLLVKSRKPRLVLRHTSNDVIAQFTLSEVGGDRVLTAAYARELSRNYGWKASCDNLPAAYLTGLLAGYKAKSKGLAEAVLDVGVKKPQAASRIYAALKGVLEAGIAIPNREETLPSDSSVQGERISAYAKTLAAAEQKSRLFSKYYERGLDPVNLPAHFHEVKQRVINAFPGGND